MKRLLGVSAGVALVVAAPIVFGQGQSGGRGSDPFFDHNDRGETIHVLPPEALIHNPNERQAIFAPPSDGSAVYGASYGSGNLVNHGGPEIPGAGFFAIYWNSTVANSTEVSTGRSGTLEQEITDFVNSFSDNQDWDNSATDDYTIVEQYGTSTTPISRLFPLAGVMVADQATTSSITDSQIQSALAGLFTANPGMPVSNTLIYGIYFPAGMTITLSGSSCVSFCGYHNHFAYNGQQIKYAVFPYLNCSACKLSTLTVADMMTIVSSHEIREAVTDPQLTAWYDRTGYEADDKCAWHNLYQMTTGGFWVQPEYSNGGTVSPSGKTYVGPGCVVPNASGGGGGGKCHGHGCL